MGKIISVQTNKGGAGKTTLATNIAFQLSLSEPNKNILLLDLDGQCGISITLGKSPKKYINSSFLNLIKQEKELKEIINNDVVYQNKNIDNLYILFSEPDLKGFDHIINEDIDIKNNFVKALKQLSKLFDYVIIDTPPSFSTLNLLTLEQSDLIISPFEPERQNIEGSLAVIEELNKKKYKNKPYIYLLPIKVKERTLIDKALLEYVDTIVNIDYKDNNKLILSEFKIPNSTQYKSVVAKEKLPLIFSKSKSKAINIQQELIRNIVNDIIKILN